MVFNHERTSIQHHETNQPVSPVATKGHGLGHSLGTMDADAMRGWDRAGNLEEKKVKAISSINQ